MMKGRPKEEPSTSVGFPAIEAVLEADSIEGVADRLSPTYQTLEDLSQTGSMKEKARAKRGMAAYERALDLMEYLFETKQALASGQSKAN